MGSDIFSVEIRDHFKIFHLRYLLKIVETKVSKTNVYIAASMNDAFVFWFKSFIRKWVKGVIQKLDRKQKYIKGESSSYSEIAKIVGTSKSSVVEIAKNYNETPNDRICLFIVRQASVFQPTTSYNILENIQNSELIFPSYATYVKRQSWRILCDDGGFCGLNCRDFDSTYWNQVKFLENILMDYLTQRYEPIKFFKDHLQRRISFRGRKWGRGLCTEAKGETIGYHLCYFQSKTPTCTNGLEVYFRWKTWPIIFRWRYNSIQYIPVIVIVFWYLNCLQFSQEEYVFMADDAPCHIARTSMNHLNELNS